MGGMKLLKAEGKAEKVVGGSNGKKGGCALARLLPLEIGKIPKETISKDPNKNLEVLYTKFISRLESHPKGGSGKTVIAAALVVWNKLLDGHEYSRKELVTDTTYKGTNSSGFEAIMKVLLELHFVEAGKTKGKSSFSDKIY